MRNITTDCTTSEGLKSILADIQALGRSGWSTRTATELLTYADRKLASTARKFGAESALAVSYAWEVWLEQTDQILAGGDAWAHTRTAVGYRLARNRQGNRLMVDEGKIRAVANGEVNSTSFDGDDELALLAAPTEATVRSLPAEGFNSAAFRTAQRLVMAATGLPDADAAPIAEAVLEEMIATGSRSSSPAGAADLLRKETAVPDALGISRAVWLASVRLLFGNPDGAVGLIEALQDGTDPSTVKHLRNSTAALERLAA